MKALSILILTITIFYGKILDFKTYQSDFTQIITNSSLNKITYTGKIFINQKSNILWEYKHPIEKKVYIKANRVFIVEPELEQVIISDIDKELNILDIINNSKKISKNKYQNSINNITYTIIIENGFLTKITYTDEIDNNIEIIFTNSEKDIELSKKIFNFIIPPEYDIIQK
jgi:outer membrane lipoprotein carrier protein